MANLFGALVGAAIDREDGDSGIKGAIIGSLTESVIRVTIPFIATYALGWALQYGVRKSWQAVTGDDPAPGKNRFKAA